MVLPVPRPVLILLALAAAGLLVALTVMGPITQPEAYHNFIDTRAWLGIPNAADVLSNSAFVLVGAFGLWRTGALALRLRSIGSAGGLAPALAGQSRGLAHPVTPVDLLCLATFFAGVLLTGPGSAWYHIEPNNTTLVWDRLPMTIAFAGLVAAVVTDRLRLTSAVSLALLAALVTAGLASVLFWHFGELTSPGTGDLRAYIVVQYGALLVAIVLAFTRGRIFSRAVLASACIAYAVAKVLETTDAPVFRLTGQLVSGHTLKHLAAAIGAAVIITSLRPRA